MSEEKLTIEQKLMKRKIKVPGTMYSIITYAFKSVFYRKYGITLTFKADPRKEKGPHILIGNHASRADYVYYGLSLLPNRYNFVLGHNEFYRSHLAVIVRLLQAIPKKNFVADYYAAKNIKRVIAAGGNICIMPEGMSSISGANQPVVNGSGKLLKSCGVPVYYGITKGGYLTNTKYNLDERFGKTEVVFDIMFTPQELLELTPQEIEDKMNLLLYHDDYAWNKERHYTYSCKGKVAEGLHTLLYRCPRCGAEFRMQSQGNTIKCLACGNGATLDEAYDMTPFDDSCVIPRTQTEWFNSQRAAVREEIKNPDFMLKEKIRLGLLPKYEYLKDQATSIISGEGTLTLSRSGLDYEGTREGEPFSFHIDCKDLPTYGMCTDLSRFYTFFNGEFLEFYPENETVEKWFLATEELHRLAGGRWKDFAFEIADGKPVM